MTIEKTIGDRNESIRIPDDGVLMDRGGREFDIVEWSPATGVSMCSAVTVVMRRRIRGSKEVIPMPPSSVVELG